MLCVWPYWLSALPNVPDSLCGVGIVSTHTLHGCLEACQAALIQPGVRVGVRAAQLLNRLPMLVHSTGECMVSGLICGNRGAEQTAKLHGMCTSHAAGRAVPDAWLDSSCAGKLTAAPKLSGTTYGSSP
jgi:hypothetical protein